MKWKNRIIETGIANPNDLIANPVNFRKHPKRQKDAINGSLDTLGWIQNVIVNKRTGRIIDGHLRVDNAIANSEIEVPVQWVDLTEEEEKQALLSLDPIAAMAETNTQMMSEIIKNINETQDALSPYLEDIVKSCGINIIDILAKDENDLPDETKVETFRKKWGADNDQLWELGNHRILCGDSKIQSNVARLLSKEKITLVFTDPPYGVSIGDKQRLLNNFDKSGSNLDDLQMDSMKPEELKKMLLQTFQSWKPFLSDDCSIFVCSPQGGELGMMMMMMKEVGLEVKHVLNWVKNSPTFSLGRLDYDYQHEPILFTWNKTHKRKKNGPFLTSVWKVDKPKANKFHPTIKPVELPECAILNHTDPDDIVSDYFLGSGTTLIACENLHRKCRGIEISPEYVSVIIERWHRLTGKDPKLIS